MLRHLQRKEGLDSIDIAGVGRISFRKDNSDFETIRQVFRKQDYLVRPAAVADRIQKRYSEILSEGKVPTIVDAGANIGAATLWFKQLYPEAHIVAVEPESGNLAVLRKNLIGKGGVTIVDAAVGADRGFVEVFNERMGWEARTRRSETGVPVITIQDAFERVPDGCPFFAKIDIEGFEGDLFSRNTEWLATVFALFIEIHDWMMPGMKTSQTMQRAVAQHDFEMFISSEHNLVFVRC